MEKKVTLTINYSQVALLVVVFGLGVALGWWRPWDGKTNRTISVTGEATLRAVPDEFVFYPSYSATGKTNSAATTAVRKIGDAVAEKIKNFGVPDNKLRTDISTNQYYFKPDGTQTDEIQATYSLTVTVDNAETAQKILDYLLSTDNQGSSTPQSGFSESKRAELRAGARTQAVNSAKTQGAQIAAELEENLGKVISVEEVTGFDSVIPLSGAERVVDSGGGQSGSSQTKLLTGEQELSFSVKVVFGI